MQTPKAFTPPYGPDDTKVVWTLDGTVVRRNGDIAFDLGSISAASVRSAAYRGDYHRLDVTVEGDTYQFASSSMLVGLDSDGWQWFVITLLRRAGSVAPNLRVDVRTIRTDSVNLLLGVLALALGLVAGLYWLTSAASDRSDAAGVLGPFVTVACIVGGLALVIANRPRSKAESLVSPDVAADLARARFKRRYRP